MRASKQTNEPTFILNRAIAFLFTYILILCAPTQGNWWILFIGDNERK